MKMGPPPPSPAQEQLLAWAQWQTREGSGSGDKPCLPTPDRLFTDHPPGLPETWSTNHQSWQLGPTHYLWLRATTRDPFRASLSDSYSLSTKQTIIISLREIFASDHCEPQATPRQRQHGKLFINALGATGATGKEKREGRRRWRRGRERHRPAKKFKSNFGKQRSSEQHSPGCLLQSAEAMTVN